MVDPTKPNPRRLRSGLIASDASVRAGTCCIWVQAFWVGALSTNCQMYRSNDPNSACTARKALAFLMVDSILRRFRTIPAFASSRCCFRESYRAITLGSNLEKARR